jgi:hypothetical protein
MSDSQGCDEKCAMGCGYVIALKTLHLMCQINGDIQLVLALALKVLGLQYFNSSSVFEGR